MKDLKRTSRKQSLEVLKTLKPKNFKLHDKYKIDKKPRHFKNIGFYLIFTILVVLGFILYFKVLDTMTCKQYKTIRVEAQQICTRNNLGCYKWRLQPAHNEQVCESYN